jgi:hypothetical protein
MYLPPMNLSILNLPIAVARTMVKALIIMTLAVISFASFADTTFPPHSLPLFSADYKANIKGFAVSATRELKALDNGQFELSFRATSWAAKIDEISTFSFTNQQAKATHYHFLQTALGKKRQRSMEFNHVEKTIKSIDKDNTTIINDIDPSVLDTLNYQLQLQLDLHNGKDNLHYKIADKGRLRDYRFEVLAEEIIETQSGNLNTVKVKVIRENKNKITYIWFAKDWSHLLVQLIQYEGDKQRLSIQLNTAKVNDITVAGI